MTSTTTTIRKSYGNRRLFAFPEDYPLRLTKQKSNVSFPKKNEEVAKLIKYIDDNIIGKNNAFLGPFGRRKGKLIFANSVILQKCLFIRLIFSRNEFYAIQFSMQILLVKQLFTFFFILTESFNTIDLNNYFIQ